MITVSGEYLGQPVSVFWNNGEMSGDSLVLLEIEILAIRNKGKMISVVGVDRHLEHPGSFVGLAKRILKNPSVTGYRPSKMKPGTVY